MRKTCADTIIDYAVKEDNAIILSGDAGLGIFCDFKDKYPSKFINMGIAEQNMISFAAGLALTGHKVFCYNITPFILYRCYEQIRNDICYQELPVVLIGTGSGITYAPQGITHYALEDLGIVNTLPNLTVFSPADPIETRLAADFTTTAKTPVYIRVAKSGEKNINTDDQLDITKPNIIRPGNKLALIFHGSISQEIIDLLKIIEEENLDIKVISIPQIQPIDELEILEALGDIKNILIVEEHYKHCGLGGKIELLLRQKLKDLNIEIAGVENEFPHYVKDNSGLRDLYNISAEKIHKKLLLMLEQ